MKNNQVKIKWPFPLILIVDICGERDLDLNSPRTEIIISDKWTDFEEKLAQIICEGIKNSVSKDYWTELLKIFESSVSSDNFKRAIKNLE
jgi:molecular chaperone HtpG